MSGLYDYRAFGLRLRSEIELPELFAEPSDDEPDVTVAFGAVPAHADPSIEFSTDDQGARLHIAGVARYRVSSGSRILIDPDQGAPAANVRLYLLGSAMGLLLHQRGLLPLHANAVEIDGKAYAFMGPSGSGKSTLAAAFHDRGYRIIADDVCVVGLENGGKAFAYPGIPRLRLWEETLAATGRSAASYELSYAGDDSFRKFDVPVTRGRTQQEPSPLGGLFLLDIGNELRLTPIRGIEAADTIFANTYRGKYVSSAGLPSHHWDTCVQLVRATPLFRFQRRWGFADFDRDFISLLGFIEQEGLGE